MIYFNIKFIDIKRKIIFIFLLFIFFFQKHYKKKLIFDKWIVITTINKPTPLIFNLLNRAVNWKIVVVGDKNTNDQDWDIFKSSNKLFYLSIKAQLNLSYNIIKYIPFSSYTRKNIGYLYAIENGAKEIYDINDNLIIQNFMEFDIYFKKDDNFNRFSLIKSNNTQMVNPYSYFGLNNVWPRGYRLEDIGKNNNCELINLVLNQTIISPLIYQGLINGEPDIDSIFAQTRLQKRSEINLSFSYNNPLIYLPGNYIPINSKNTKYLFEAFPALPLLTTVSEKVSDILRGFIMQRYIWGYNGTVFYFFTSSSKKGKFLNNSNFDKEKHLYYKLNDILKILNLNKNNKINNQAIFLLNIIENLVNYNIIERNDLDMYKAFIQDLSNIGYIFNHKYSTQLNYSFNNFINIKSEIITNTRFQNKILLKNNGNPNEVKIICHYISKKIYNNILLVINYNNPSLLYLNKYMIYLYKKTFPNLIFISPSKNYKNDSIINCPESRRGFYEYMCFRKVFNKYPNMKGYLILNDDNFMKTWHLDNYDFNIPWLNEFQISHWKIFLRNPKQFWVHFRKAFMNLNNIISKNLEWKQNITDFIGSYGIPKVYVDNMYFPNSMFNKFIDIVEQMYKRKIFHEIAIPSALGIINLPRYKLSTILALWGRDRIKNIKYLKRNLDNTFLHPIKLSNKLYWKEVTKYIFFY